jgi:hypothetical protein
MEDLPSEVLVEVFSHLGAKDICSLQLICSKWQAIAKDESLWKRLVERDYQTSQRRTIVSGSETPNLETWLAVYQRMVLWAWDETHKYPNITLSNRNRTAEHHGEGSYHVVRCSRGLMWRDGGVYFFEVRIDQNTGNSQSVGISMGGFLFERSNTGGWGQSHNGIGWYCDGNVYSSRRTHESIGTWRAGDHLGILLNLDKEEPTVTFYTNRVRASPPDLNFTVVKDDTEISSDHDRENGVFYLHSFLGADEKVTLVYCGPKPNDLHESKDL